MTAFWCSELSSTFPQSLHLQLSPQKICRWKHSQYILRHFDFLQLHPSNCILAIFSCLSFYLLAVAGPIVNSVLFGFQLGSLSSCWGSVLSPWCQEISSTEEWLWMDSSWSIILAFMPMTSYPSNPLLGVLLPGTRTSPYWFRVLLECSRAMGYWSTMSGLLSSSNNSRKSGYSWCIEWYYMKMLLLA